MKRFLPKAILSLLFLAGIALLLYPSVSDYVNKHYQSEAIELYVHAASQTDSASYAEMLAQAQAYNQECINRQDPNIPTSNQEQNYSQILDVSGTGIMAYLEIPAIDCSLAIYHGTDEGVLQRGVGHLEQTSLPVGGESSHCVISGHRGLPSAELFSDLDQLGLGDIFIIRVLDQILTYEITEVKVVEPSEIDGFPIQAGKDLCTLMTCTPYGVNTHRLLLTGERIANPAATQSIAVVSNANVFETLPAAAIFAIPLFIIALIVLALIDRRAEA